MKVRIPVREKSLAGFLWDVGRSRRSDDRKVGSCRVCFGWSSGATSPAMRKVFGMRIAPRIMVVVLSVLKKCEIQKNLN